MKIFEVTNEQDVGTNATTARAATQRAALDGSTRDLPIPPEIADPVLKIAPSLKQFVIYNPTHGVLGIKTKNGAIIKQLQQRLTQAGYDLQVDGIAGNNTQAAIIDIFYAIAAAKGIGGN